MVVPGGASGATPVVSQESALAGPESAIIRARIDPGGEEAHCKLELVEDAKYVSSSYAEATSVPCTPEDLAAGTEERNVIAEVSGLQINTGYHFRFVATNTSGEEKGADTAFATFGIEAFDVAMLNAKQELLTQAGAHPFEYTTTIAINHGTEDTSPSGDLRDVEVELPVGLVGDPAATPRCVSQEAEDHECGGAAQVGTMVVAWGEEGGKEGTEVRPLFNITPPTGVAATFSARFNGFVNAFIDAKVRTGGDYGIDAYSLNITRFTDIRRVIIKMWGVPAETVHDTERSCPVLRGESHEYVVPCSEKGPEVPFLTNPTSCSGHEVSEVAMADAWQAPGRFADSSVSLPAVTGCGNVGFKPSLAIAPESTSTDSPSGLQVDLHVPQNEEPGDLATANLKDATVTLPAGITVNPAEASGLVGCSLLKGKELREGEIGIDLENSEPAKCPEASKIGKVTLETPLIEHPLPGYVYLAQQGNAGGAHGANPFGSLLALYIAIYDEETGVVVKLAGQVVLNPSTGQLTTIFNENPQLPFENLKLEFFGGQRAPLATPMTCGSYGTTSLLEPWSHEASGEVGTPDAAPSSEFQITSMAGGGACGSPGFAPSLVAGTTDNRAGAYSPMTTTLTRKDGEQTFKSVSLTLPKGLAGVIANVSRCDEAEAGAGSCPASTQIGHVTVQAGVGTEPLTLPEPGKQEDPVYLTGPYEGAPFGLAIVVHPEAGPFDLAEGAGTANEKPVVVRAKIEVDPHTAQVSIVTDSSGPYSMPTVLQGVPVDVEAVNVVVDRPNFIFNPTSCEPMNVTGTIGSAEGASAKVSSRFQAADCGSLPFKPKFSVFTHADHTRRNGEYLRVVVKSTLGQANIGRVHVSLPKVLAARDSTLNLACTEKQFAVNPAGCPPGSFVGTATATTPVLSKPLTGPAIFVGHGGAKFPDLDVVLQGEGVTVILTGNTDITNDITSSTFASVPDVPVNRFVLTLPSESNSALAGYGNMCAQPLIMPTTITGQNGAVLEKNTSINVEGCSLKLSVLSHKVKEGNAAMSVYVPSAGKVHAAGQGLSSQTKTIEGRGVLNFKLHQRRAGRQSAHVLLSFTPASGKAAKRQTKRLTLKFAS